MRPPTLPRHCNWGGGRAPLVVAPQSGGYPFTQGRRWCGTWGARTQFTLACRGGSPSSGREGEAIGGAGVALAERPLRTAVHRADSMRRRG